MNKILVSIPENIAARFRAAVPARQRSKVIVRLLEKELLKRERLLYECALAVENDKALNDEMKEWDDTIGDGIDDESR